MATYTAYPTKAGKFGGITFTNKENIIDSDENTYGSYITNNEENTTYYMFYGFDFSKLPANATINKISVITKYDSPAKHGYRLHAVRKYTNGSFVDNSTQGYTFSSTSNTNNDTTTLSDTSGGLYFGPISLNDLKQTQSNPENSSSYTGLGFYMQFTSSSKYSSLTTNIYYFKVVIDYTPVSHTISTAVSPANTGSVTGGGTYPDETNVTLTATPSSGYKFVQWQDGNTTNPRTITVSQDITYTATFAPDSYIISTAISQTGTGTVTGGGTYTSGSTVTLTATPAIGYKFLKWSDNNTSNPRSITVSSNTTYTAIFESSSQIYLGTQRIQNLYLGTTQIKKVFIGTKQIY